MRLFCFGLGYVAGYLAQAVIRAGGSVSGTTRSAEKCAALRELGVNAYVMGQDEIQQALSQATHIIVSIPPDILGEDVNTAYMEYINNGAWIGYLSTTGVYGDCKGEWVDENSLTQPTEARSSARLQAEKRWRALGKGRGITVQIFRLGGIYGPGRNTLEQLQRGTARRIDKPGHYFSRIHIDDIVQVLQAAMSAPQQEQVYNVCDDSPSSSREVVEYASSLLGMEPPPLEAFETAGLSPVARSFYAANRRVCNDRIKQVLGVRLRYPTYREGIRSIYHNMQNGIVFAT